MLYVQSNSIVICYYLINNTTAADPPLLLFLYSFFNFFWILYQVKSVLDFAKNSVFQEEKFQNNFVAHILSNRK